MVFAVRYLLVLAILFFGLGILLAMIGMAMGLWKAWLLFAFFGFIVACLCGLFHLTTLHLRGQRY